LTTEPLIYTSRGNLPIASLAYSHRWENTDDYLKFVETYKASDGEVVRESVHVYGKRQLDIGAAQAAIA
jgi:hypothetical protein